ncbi:hypothetical protein [Endozoicomonas sp. YOMI1]|uniref:hypothetical protein n=1 Tax=Endozoicomonas sp. YOMI1 TaxID=2828739 RepID=UPI002148CD39|nr:hypothetical protein [Endozoicomonas sp. YOMI1]
MDVELKAYRSNNDDSSIDTRRKRSLQQSIFFMNKDRFEENRLSLSRFDNKESSEILKELESLKIFSNTELDDIRKYLIDELDSSPYWE